MKIEIKKLIARLERPEVHWHIISLYISREDMDTWFLDFLKIIQRDRDFRKGKVKNPEQILAIAIKKPLKMYVKMMKSKIEREEEYDNKASEGENTEGNTLEIGWQKNAQSRE